MKRRKLLACVAGFLGCLLVGKSAADEVKEVAVLGVFTEATKVRPVNSLAFSADGSRLVVAGGMAQDPANPTKMSQANWVIWDVAKKKQISFCPGAGTAFAWITADGRHVISPRAHIKIWDGPTTKVLPSPYDELKVRDVRDTAEALSPDGAYLAVAFNDYSKRIKPAPAGQPRLDNVKSHFGGIDIWDLKAQKMKWRIGGAEVESMPTSKPDFRSLEVHRLAFSPDGTRLAALLPNKLNVYALEAGKEAPALKMTADQTLVTQRIAEGHAQSNTGEGTQFEFRWVADGKSLLLRNRAEFEFLDAATGARKEKFELKAPPEAPKPSPAKLPSGKEPKAGGGSAPPEQPAPYASSLSADAKLLAIVAVERPSRELAIAIWDVAGRRRQAILKLPAEKFGVNAGARGGYYPIALSPNGKQLAVADRLGAVHVYDVAQIVDH